MRPLFVGGVHGVRVLRQPHQHCVRVARANLQRREALGACARVKPPANRSRPAARGGAELSTGQRRHSSGRAAVRPADQPARFQGLGARALPHQPFGVCVRSWVVGLGATADGKVNTLWSGLLECTGFADWVHIVLDRVPINSETETG